MCNIVLFCSNTLHLLAIQENHNRIFTHTKMICRELLQFHITLLSDGELR